MNRIEIIITLLLICSISYAGYVTIEKEKITIGDGTKIIGELPIQKRVEVVGETKDRYIIKYNSHPGPLTRRFMKNPRFSYQNYRPFHRGKPDNRNRS